MASIKTVAIVGATGNVGKHIVTSLLATKKHTITALTRPESTATIDPSLKVKKIDYNNHASLVDALRGQDALIITLSVKTPGDHQTKLIEAAAEAGVPWILPNEFGSDNAHPDIGAIPLYSVKRKYRDQIEELGKSKWIGVVNALWYEFGLGGGGNGLGFDIKNRTASMYDEGNNKTVTTTFSQVGRAVAALLSLPVTGSSPCLSDWSNKFFYIESFFLSQNDILASLKRVTGTKDSDWKVSYRNGFEAVAEGNKQLAKGNFRGGIDVIYGTVFLPGKGGDYSQTKGTANKALGLPVEDLDEVTSKVVEEGMSKKEG